MYTIVKTRFIFLLSESAGLVSGVQQIGIRPNVLEFFNGSWSVK